MVSNVSLVSHLVGGMCFFNTCGARKNMNHCSSIWLVVSKTLLIFSPKVWGNCNGNHAMLTYMFSKGAVQPKGRFDCETLGPARMKLNGQRFWVTK